MTTLKKPIVRVSNDTLDNQYGPDSGRKVAIKLIPGNGADVEDLIELRPHGTRRAEVIPLLAVYHYAIRSRVNSQRLEKARGVKAKKAERRLKAKIAYQDSKYSA